MNLVKFYEDLRKGYEEKKTSWNITRQLNAPDRAPQACGQLFGVRLAILTSNSNFKTTLNQQNFLFRQFYFEKNYPPKITKVTKQPET